VSISGGALVAIAGGVLNAHFARHQAARQFAHERGMADRAELRAYLREVLATLQDVMDYILGLPSDLDAVSGMSPDVLAGASEPGRVSRRQITVSVKPGLAQSATQSSTAPVACNANSKPLASLVTLDQAEPTDAHQAA
jgi:hypothetical protein